MNGMEQPGFTSFLLTTRDNGALREDLLRAVHGESALPETCVTFAMHWHEQQQAAAELLEREIWAADAIIEASARIWDQLPQPTLMFAYNGGAPAPGQIELGRFIHLSDLHMPTEQEQLLIDSPGVCWARVTASQEREGYGSTGALARAYEPISTENAVVLIGLDRIVAQIETAVSEAGRVLVAGARVQEERRARLEHVERKLGLTSPTASQVTEPMGWRTRFLIGLVGQEDRNWLAACAGVQGLFVICLCFMLQVPLLLLALLPVLVSLLIWRCAGE
jgi:hypothetical protein